MIGLVPNIFCGGYTYERVVIFGSIWTIQSLIAIIVIVVKNIQNFLDDVYYPFSNGEYKSFEYMMFFQKMPLKT